MTDSVPSCSRCGYESKYNLNNHIKRKNMCKPLLNNEPPTIVTMKTVENTATIEDDGVSDLIFIDRGHTIIINTLQFVRIRPSEQKYVRVETNEQEEDSENVLITIKVITPTETRIYLNIPRSECIKFLNFIIDTSKQFPEDMSHKEIKAAMEKEYNRNIITN